MLQWCIHALVDSSAYTKKHKQAFLAPLLGTVAIVSPNLVHPCILVFYHKNFPFSFLSPWSNLPFKTLSTPKDEFLEQPPSKPIIASGYELRSGFIAMAWEQTFSG